MSVFTLEGEIKLPTRDLEQSLRSVEQRLGGTEKALSSVERQAKHAGDTTATTARSFERLSERLNETRGRLTSAAQAFSRGDITAKQFERAVQSANGAAGRMNSTLRDSSARLKDFANRASEIPAKLQQVGQGIRNMGATLTATLTTGLVTLGTASLKSATSIDALRNKLTAATGSITAANAKLRELRDLANSSAGVFSATAADLFAFFKPMKVGEQNINSLIRAFGRLQLADEMFEGKEFGRNLTQLFTQGFEMQDLKQAIGRMPRFGELIAKQFGLKDGSLDTIKDSLNGMKAAGKLTLEGFLSGFAEAVNNDQTLGLLTDTVGIRFQKAMERVMIAIEPLGRAVLDIIEPMIPPIVAFIEKISSGFQSLSPEIKQVIVVIGGLAAAAGPALIAFGALVGAIASIIAAAKGIAIVGGIVAGLAVAFAAAGAAAAALYEAYQTNFGGIKDYVDQAAQQIRQIWNNLSREVTAATAQMVAEVKAFWEENGEDIKAALSKVEAFVRRSLKTMADFWTENGDTIKSIVTNVWEIVKTVVVTGTRAVMSAIKLVAAVINGDWSKAWDALKSIVGEAMGASVKIVTRLLSTIGSLFVMTLKSIFTTLKAAVSEMYAIGANIMQGLYDGLKSKAPDVMSFARSTASTILSTFSSVMWIRSPSRKMMEIGEYVMEGLNLGMASKTEKVVNTVKTIAGAVTKEFQDMQKRLSEITSGNSATVGGYGQTIGLRIQLTDAEKVKSDLEELIKLRIELGANLNMPIFNAAAEIQSLTRIKDVFGELNDTISEFVDFKPGFAEMLALFSDPNAKKILEERAAALKLNVDQLERLVKIQAATDALKSAGKNIAEMPEVGEGRGDGNGVGLGLGELNSMTDVFGGNVPEVKAKWEDFFASFRIGIAEIKESLPDIKTAIGENLINSIYGIGDVFANAIARWDGTAKGFFKSLAAGFADMARQIISEMIRIAVMKAVLNLVGMFGGAAAGSAVGGASSIGGGIGAHGGHGFAAGGFTGVGGQFDPAGIVHRNEFVMPMKAVKRFGLGFMNQIKNLQMPSTMPAMAMAGGATTNNNQRSNVFNINVSGGGSAEQQRQSAIAVRKEILKGLYKEEMRNR